MMNGREWNVPPRNVAAPVIVPRAVGWSPRPLTLPSSESASERPMLIAGAERRRQADEERGMRAGQEGRGEDGGQGGDGAVDEPDQRRAEPPGARGRARRCPASGRSVLPWAASVI